MRGGLPRVLRNPLWVMKMHYSRKRKRERENFFERKNREREGGRDFPFTVLFPKWPQSQVWTRLELGSRKYVWASHIGVPSQALKQGVQSDAEQWDSNQHSNVGHLHHKLSVNPLLPQASYRAEIFAFAHVYQVCYIL